MTRTALVLICLAVSAVAGAAEPTEEQARFFEAKVRPVLVDQCFKCHGPEKQKAGLRLDSRAAMLAGGDSGPAIEPGDADASLLVEAVRQVDDFLKMPPSKKLAREQVDALADWVAAGAPWPGEDPDAAAAAVAASKGGFAITDEHRNHWAFRPIEKPEPPAVADPAWSANPVDAFVAAGLDAKGLRPNPPAGKVELIRRATYDLHGLPPTPEEVDAFLADASPDAYEKLVDRLLDSPRYGEKWGRHWLDLVRFAETNSYERDNPKPSAWRYRDYVIQSLNADKPYDRFIREQLAGDELPDRSPETITATGYYRLGIWDDEPTDREQAFYDGLDDVVATTAQVFLGLTVDCARCHDHKIDPISQKDYYKFVSFFRNVNPYRNGGPTDEMPYVEPGTEAHIEARARELAAERAEVRREIAAIEEAFLKALGQPEGSARPDVEDLRYRFFRDTWDRLPDFDALKHEDAGTLSRGLFDLAPRTRDEAFGFAFEGTLAVPADGTYTFHLAADDGARLRVGDSVAVERDGMNGLDDEQSGAVELEAGRVPIRLDYFQQSGTLGLKLAWSGPGFDRRPLSADPDVEAPDLAQLIREQGRQVLGRERMGRYRQLRRRHEELKREKANPHTILRVTEAGPEAPETYVLARGNAHTPGEPVEPGYLDVLGGEPAEIPAPQPGAESTGRRKALADWIAREDNPLTARVMANRIFQHHFGRGIVRSPNNFGVQGDAPTHPALLDWLAAELRDGGWRLKPIHRLLMTSNTYRMSSRPDAEALAKDPTNDALWRFDMRRLTAEEIRDSILAVTGTLNLGMYGPGVYPQIPAEVMAGQSVPGKGWGESSAEERARRSIYVHVKRSLLVPILESFDAAETDRSTPARFSTTQPTQALGMLNGSFLHEQAAALADRLAREAGPEPAGQVRRALRLVTGREPAEDEVARGVALIDDLADRHGLGQEAARRAFCLYALNLNEFLYLD